MNQLGGYTPPYFAAFGQWQIFFWATYYSWIGSELWLFIRDRKRVHGIEGDRGSRTLLIIVMTLCLVGAFGFGFTSLSPRIPMRPLFAFSLGIALMWSGVALRLWSVHTLGRFFRTSVFLQEGHELVESGPYHLIRNPSYTGALITLFGLGLAIGNWISLALTVIGPLIAFLRRIHVEEAALAAHFDGSYKTYSAHTWRLIPWVW